MTYTSNTWANGDVITSAKLNNLETGVQEGIAAATAADKLPVVTGADEGKVATVNSTGNWGAVLPAHGIFWVTLAVTEDEETGETVLSVDKTLAEIASAVGDGKLPIVNAAELGESNCYLIPNFIHEQSAYFSAGSWLPAEFEGSFDSVSFAKVYIGGDGSVSYSASQYDFPRT